MQQNHMAQEMEEILYTTSKKPRMRQLLHNQFCSSLTLYQGPPGKNRPSVSGFLNKLILGEGEARRKGGAQFPNRTPGAACVYLYEFPRPCA